MKPRKIMSRHHATSSQRGRTSLNALIILFFTSDWFKPVRTCVTWSFSSLSRIRAGWMILQVCTWSQADRQTKRRSGLIISLCGSPEGESPARAPPHMQMVETPSLRGPPPIKTPPAAIINNKHCGRRWQMVAKCLCCQIYQLEQKISICSSETEALPETTGSWNAPLGRVLAAAVTRFCTADSCLTFSRTAAGNEIFKSPRRGKQNTKHSPSPSPEPDPGSVRTQETRQPSVTSSWAVSYTLTSRPVWWHCRTTQFCSAAGPRKRPGGLAGSDLQLHQEMDSDGINLGAETLI